MHSPRSRLAVAFVVVALAACGGSVTPNTGSSSSSGGASSGSSGASGGTSSGSTGSSGTGSSGSTGSSGVSSSGSSGGRCTDGQEGPLACKGGCNGGVVPEICVGGQWTCPPVPPCPPPTCGGPPPPCACPIDCKCQAVCDPGSGQWSCQSACAVDASAPFACGDKNCVAGDVCIDVAGKNGGPPTGPYECLPNPSACANDYSCGCEMNALKAAGTCDPVSCDQTFGNVVVSCASL